MHATLHPQTAAPARLLGSPIGSDYRAHLQAWGELQGATNLVSEIQNSGLTGRGGAGFPAGRKIAALEGAPRLIVANASEGEPLSSKDSALLRDAPHLVFDGLRALGDALAPRAQLTVVTHPRSLEAAERALAQRPDRARFRVRAQVDTFVAGEATAVVARVHGDRAVPSDHRYRLTSSARPRGPVLLFNAETMAHIGLIARFGSAWFRHVGIAVDPGTRLFTLATEAGPRAVLELPGGSTVRDVLEAGGLDPQATSAVLVGGYHGQWIGPDDLGLPLTTGRGGGELRAGAGVILALQGTACPLQVTASIVAYLAAQSARQCGPCTAGLPRLSLDVQALARGDHDAAARIERRGDTIAGRGACHHPDGTVRLARSAARVFAGEAAAHAAGTCRMGGTA